MCFQMDGKIPKVSDLLKREVSSNMMVSAPSLIIPTDISSRLRPLEAADERAAFTSD